MLTPAEVEETVRDLWSRFQAELPIHDDVYDYVRGRLGVPSVPEGSGDELQDLAKMAVKNVLPLVEDAFTQSMMVVGFRAESDETDADVWQKWQERRLDARQSAVHRSMVRYGTGYVIELPHETHVRSPRQVFAVYEDPHVDEWPIYVIETWIDRSEGKPLRRANLYDDEMVYPVTLGSVHRETGSFRDGDARSVGITFAYDPDDAYSHAAPHCPVVRFVNDYDAEDVIRGEIAPLLVKQRALNVVNFDRLVVSRYGAFPQKYVIGWDPSGSDELARASAARLMAFADDQIKVGDFAQASVEPYNAILEEMVRDIAMTAQIPPFVLTGDILNIAAEAAAMIEAPYQRKAALKREAAGESWEQYLRLVGTLHNIEVPDNAEVQWESTEARSFGAVVDGITKLTAAGVPIEELLQDIPGWTQQRVDAARAAIRRNAGRGVLDALRQAASSGDSE